MYNAASRCCRGSKQHKNTKMIYKFVSGKKLQGSLQPRVLCELGLFGQFIVK